MDTERPSGSADGMARIEATVRGRVQGVGFRWYVSRLASRLEVTGWVANESDGSVHVVAEGNEAALVDLLESLERGPAGASVAEVSVERMAATGSFQGFAIRSGGHRGD
jgi:acylphosphatase